MVAHPKHKPVWKWSEAMDEAAKIKGQTMGGMKAARRQIELIAGLPDAEMNFRFFHDADKTAPATKLHSDLNDARQAMKDAQAEGNGIFFVVNGGGNTDAEISDIRAVFIDGDNMPLPERWHLQPDFIVQRDALHFHAYWLAHDCPIDRFAEIQKRLAAYYRTDPKVFNPSRVMRLAGTENMKAEA
jgi:hypothetical protein